MCLLGGKAAVGGSLVGTGGRCGAWRRSARSTCRRRTVGACRTLGPSVWWVLWIRTALRRTRCSHRSLSRTIIATSPHSTGYITSFHPYLSLRLHHFGIVSNPCNDENIHHLLYARCRSTAGLCRQPQHPSCRAAPPLQASHES